MKSYFLFYSARQARAQSHTQETRSDNLNGMVRMIDISSILNLVHIFLRDTKKSD